LSSPHPSPPAASTLSLHDALPICSQLRQVLKHFKRILEVSLRIHGSDQIVSADAGQSSRCTSSHSADSKTHLRLAFFVIEREAEDRKSTRLNSSHLGISYAVFCLK